MNVIRRASQTVSSVASGTTSVVSGTASRIIRASTGYSLEKQVNVNECDEEFIFRSAKDKVNIQLKCTPAKDAATTGALALKRMFVLKRNEQGQYNRKMICTVPHMFLYYFDSDTADSARGIIDLYYYTSISIEGENILKLSAPEETGLKSFFFQIDDPNTLSELITSLHRDRYNVVRDERDAYQQLQDQFSGEMEGASKQLVLSEQERELMRQEIGEAKRLSDEAMEALDSALLRFGVSEVERSAMQSISSVGEALNEKIENLKRQLTVTIEENDKLLALERDEFSAQIAQYESLLAAEQLARKSAEASLLAERREFDFRARDAQGTVDRLNLNLQVAVDARDAAEEKVNTLSEQKKVLVKEVKLLRKKLETSDSQLDQIKQLNDRLSVAAEELQKQNKDRMEQLVAANNALLVAHTSRSPEGHRLSADDSNVPAAVPTGVVMGIHSPSVELATLKYGAVIGVDDSINSVNNGEGGESLDEHADRANSHDRGSSSAAPRTDDELAWLSPEQRQHLLTPIPTTTNTTATSNPPAPARRASAFAGLFTSHDKHAARPLLRLSETDEQESIGTSEDHSGGTLPPLHSSPEKDSTVGDKSISEPGGESPMPSYSATYAMMQAMLPVEGKIYCLRCNGTVEGPKYSTCKCKVPALTHDMLVLSDQPTSISRVGTGVSQVGSSLFGMLRRASGVIAPPTRATAALTTPSNHSSTPALHSTNVSGEASSIQHSDYSDHSAPNLGGPLSSQPAPGTIDSHTSVARNVNAENDPREPQ